MTREEELELLIEEQRKDDATRVIYSEPGHPRGISIVPLDKPLEEGDETLADRVCGVVYDLEDGDDVGHLVTYIGQEGVQHGHALMQIEHGTYNGYHNQGCRCPSCTRANTIYIVRLQRMARKREQDARPDRICENENCRKSFRPVPSTKRFCSYRCADTTCKRRKRRAEARLAA